MTAEANSSATCGIGPLLPGPPPAGHSIRQALYECIRAHGRISRSDAARRLEVSAGSVTVLAAELIALGLVEEVPSPIRDPGRGRPPVALRVVPEAGFVAGIKFSDRVNSAILLDYAGTPRAEAAEPHSHRRLSPETILSESERLLDRLCQSAGLARAEIGALGLGIPGFVDARSGEVLWSPLVDTAPMAARAAEALGLPVHVDNDANLLTLAEQWFGGARGRANFAVVTIEHGVGMGLVLNHGLYHGAQGLGTELGHTKVQLDGALCRCGQRGCLEAYVADYALVREASTALNWPVERGQPASVLLNSLYDHAKAGNPAARSIFRRAGRYLAAGLATVANLFDLEVIMLSGERLQYDYLYAEDVFQEFERLTLDTSRPKPRMETHAWGDLVWARGAGAMALAAETNRRLAP